mmetsp:Transcript_14984/g.44537  ORF Transcript_14984/g.44537 Transcript_14984/m.44537 type:complete len:272 (-) Transcript_14984:79-894(-)
MYSARHRTCACILHSLSPSPRPPPPPRTLFRHGSGAHCTHGCPAAMVWSHTTHSSVATPAAVGPACPAHPSAAAVAAVRGESSTSSSPNAGEPARPPQSVSDSDSVPPSEAPGSISPSSVASSRSRSAIAHRAVSEQSHSGSAHRTSIGETSPYLSNICSGGGLPRRANMSPTSRLIKWTVSASRANVGIRSSSASTDSCPATPRLTASRCRNREDRLGFCQHHSNFRAAMLLGKPYTTTSIRHGRPDFVLAAPPLIWPLCCRSLLRGLTV